ncbi:E3 ubiquitin-protein ligase RING1-like [Dermacentor albipictus]|uniref:E3 ubiquitin-protein ligase RING1-like n=1 Tax=Dermacentor albipictus TaxID=60249 RepID=UPI0031FDC8F7
MTSSGASKGTEGKWQLSPYEHQRTAQEVIADATEEVAAHADSIRNEFTCAICLGLLQDTVASTECGHRFCEKCITAVLLKSNKVCPVCRARIPSKRCLRRDHRMDSIIAALYRNQEQHGAAHLHPPAEPPDCPLAQAIEEHDAEDG